MNNISISRDQQRDLHNARCYFQSFADKYADILGQRVIADFNHAYDIFKRAHDPIREEENARMDRRYDHYEAIRKHLGLKTIWSDYDVELLDEGLPLKLVDITHVRYYNQLVAVEKPMGSPRWLDLWIAADKAILQSDDPHHIYVEGFYRKDDYPIGVYQVITGS